MNNSTSPAGRLPAVLTMPGPVSALGIARSMGQRGIHTICADQNRTCATWSKYSEYLPIPNWANNGNEEETLQILEKRAARESQKPVFFPCSDEVLFFLSRHRERLARSFHFVIPDHNILTKLINKFSLFQMARQYGLPTPICFLPRTMAEAEQQAAEMTYPCLLKSLYSYAPLSPLKSVCIPVHNQQELMDHFGRLHDADPNLMITEIISGKNHHGHIYAAYWDQHGETNISFTGRKVRQLPWGQGIMCSCDDNHEIVELMHSFCKKINFRGLIDVDIIHDQHDGHYKVLDINPRIGQNFRTFLTTEGIDLPYAQYCDLTGNPVTSHNPTIDRYWIIEDQDFTKSLKNVLLGRLSLIDWLKPYGKVEEVAYFSRHDLRPWFFHCWQKIRGFPAWLKSPTAAPLQILQKLKLIFAINK